MFAYCGNNPINYVDHGGTAAVSIKDSTIPSTTTLLMRFGALAIGMGAVSISIKSKENTKSEVIALPKQNNGGATYYHVTTLVNANSIKLSQIIYGSTWEGWHVFAWRLKPTRKAVEKSGAHFGVIISFKTNAAFTPDKGIGNAYAQAFLPVVTVFPGPIRVWDVKIVG